MDALSIIGTVSRLLGLYNLLNARLAEGAATLMKNGWHSEFQVKGIATVVAE